MKRIRAEEEEEELTTVDWTRLFHIDCILVVLQRYLSTPDLIHLSCVNKWMNTTWINNDRRLRILNMRERVHQLTGRLYGARTNPVLFMKKACRKASGLPVKGAKKFTCWKCKHSKSMSHFVTKRDLFPFATCVECAKKKMEETHLCGSTYFAIEWYMKKVLVPIGIPVYYLEIWLRENKSVLEATMVTNVKAFFFNEHYWSYYTPIEVVLPLIERAQQEIMTAINSPLILFP